MNVIFRHITNAFFILFISSCNSKEIKKPIFYNTGAIELNGIQITVEDIRDCHSSSANNSLKLKKGKKIILFNIKISRTMATGKTSPADALLMDTRGNLYTVFPGIVSMAQANQCIKGDDIKAYNAIWNESMKVNETQQAFLIGYEIAEDALPEKLYWNKEWLNSDVFLKL